MKVTKTSTQPVFQPIELKITIESQEEFDLLINLWHSSEGVHDTLTKVVGDKEAYLLERMLDTIGEVLWKVQ